MATRWMIHCLLGAPWLIALIWLAARLGFSLAGLASVAIVAAGVELAVIGLPVLAPVRTFRLALATRRRLPRVWNDYAGRTNRVQAATGQEPSAPIRHRPIVDHPRISWLFFVDRKGSVEFMVGPPPDRTFIDLAEACPALSARLPFVERLDVEYESDRSSFGVLRVTFAEGPGGPIRKLLTPSARASKQHLAPRRLRDVW